MLAGDLFVTSGVRAIVPAGNRNKGSATLPALLPREGSNLDHGLQRPVCCRYTMGEYVPGLCDGRADEGVKGNCRKIRLADGRRDAGNATGANMRSMSYCLLVCRQPHAGPDAASEAAKPC